MIFDAPTKYGRNRASPPSWQIGDALQFEKTLFRKNIIMNVLYSTHGRRACGQRDETLGLQTGEFILGGLAAGDPRREFAIQRVQSLGLDHVIDDQGPLVAERCGDFLGFCRPLQSSQRRLRPPESMDDRSDLGTRPAGRWFFGTGTGTAELERYRASSQRIRRLARLKPTDVSGSPGARGGWRLCTKSYTGSSGSPATRSRSRRPARTATVTP
jgi:hypothetical protein